MPNTTQTDRHVAAVRSPTWACAVLDSINWSFSTPFSVGRSGVRLFDSRKYHWYPATYVPDIPNALIDVLTEPGANVYDPFSGIGTTAFQALFLGRQPLGSEINAAAVRLGRSLWHLLSSREAAPDAVSLTDELLTGYNPAIDYISIAADATNALVDGLQPWFAAETLNQVLYLHMFASARSDSLIGEVVALSLSATVKSICAQDRGGWGCIADNVRPKPEQIQANADRDAIGRVTRHLRSLLRDVADARRELPDLALQVLDSRRPEEVFLQHDVKTGIPCEDESIDLVVTSPPYPGMTDYSTAQRLSYYLMGMDPMVDTTREIGARRRRFSDRSLTEYVDEMRRVIGMLTPKVRQNGYVCFVMPDFAPTSEKSERRRSCVQECLAGLHEQGAFTLVKELSRMLPTRRRQHNQQWAKLEREVILVYRRL